MPVLLPTGAATYQLVSEAAAGFDAAVVVTGEIASFLTPPQLLSLLKERRYDLVIVSGMCTASFEQVEQETGVPVYRGPRHAADLPLILSRIDSLELSRTLPADELIRLQRQEESGRKLAGLERSATPDLLIRGVKIGGGSRMKVLAEVMDAPRQPDLAAVVTDLFSRGADIVDLGFGFDATPKDVRRCFSAVESIEGPLAVDSQDPALIRAALFRADLVLSLHEENIPLVGAEVAAAGVAAVVVPRYQSLVENLALAEEAGIVSLIADPLLQPVGSGLVRSLQEFLDEPGYPLFFGAGNITELIDADSVGVQALLAGMALEVHAALVFSCEHSDKTHGAVQEMRLATEMMMLVRCRPYPKDVGLDLLVIKEKRRRREPPLVYQQRIEVSPLAGNLTYDPAGNFRIGIEDDQIVAVHNGTAFAGSHWEEVFAKIQAEGLVSLLDHAAYLGKELYKAELALRFGRSFEQDGPF
jgi:dihydropteroate synthase-like protein